MIAGVCAAVAILLVLTLVIAITMGCKREKRENYTSKRYCSDSHSWSMLIASKKHISDFRLFWSLRKVHSAPGKLNPMFQEGSTKGKPQISAPTFMESTATQACTPLMVSVVPSRAAPQVRHNELLCDVTVMLLLRQDALALGGNLLCE